MSPSFRARRSATIGRFASATPRASTSSKRVSIDSRIFAGRCDRSAAMKLATASLDKAAVVNRIKTERAIAVIRTDSIASALNVAEAVIAAGFRAIEITFSFPEASNAIATLAQNNERDLLIGAGTILTREDVHEAVSAGAQFLVSPCVLPEVIDAAR